MTTAIFIERLKIFEGDYNYFYLDSTRHVTIGVGIMFRDSASVIKSGIRFRKKEDNKPASTTEIVSDFDLVKKSAILKAIAYAKITKLRANPDDLNKEFMKRYDEATKNARKFYDKAPIGEKSTYLTFDSLPENVRFALIDLSFNLGPNNLNKFQNLRKYLKKGEWSKAAKESHRFNIQDSRNMEIEKWISENIEFKY